MQHLGEVEQSYLGSLFMDAEETNLILEDCKINHKDFFDPANRVIFEVIEKLYEDNQEVDVFTVINELASKNKLEFVGGASYLTNIAERAVTNKNIKHAEGIIKLASRKRDSDKLLKRMNDKIQEAETEKEIDELLTAGFDHALKKMDSGGFEHISEVGVEIIDDMEQDREEVYGIVSGFEELDKMTSGFHGGQFGVFGARPGLGKTAFALNVASNASNRIVGNTGQTALVPFYSLEMKNKSLGQRLLSSESNVNSRNLKIGHKALQQDDWSKVAIGLGELSKKDIMLKDKAGISVNEIRADLRKLRRKYPDRPILCMIDYLQLITAPNTYKGNKVQEIGEISRILKLTALELDVCIIALSQLSRGVEQRQDKRPMLSDLRESGNIEQDCDFIGFLYRDDYYDKETDNKNIAECIIAKQRDGAVGTVQLAFIREYGKFLNLERSI